MSLPDRFKASVQESSLKLHIIKGQESGDIWKLNGLPTRGFLRKLTELPIDEMAPFETNSQWFVLVGAWGSVPLTRIPMEATIIMHTHPGENSFYRSLPSVEDFIHPRNPSALYYTISPLAIIRYYPINPPIDKYVKIYHWENEQYKQGYMSNKELEDRYTQFLQEQGLKWEAYSWSQIRDEKDLRLILTFK